MARVKVHIPCMRPLAECYCADDDDGQVLSQDDGDGDDVA